jgi:hypothetical protein
MAAGPLYVTLVGSVVSTLTLDLPDPAPDNLSFATPKKARVEALNVTGTAAVYFTTDGTTPVVGANGTHCLPAAIGFVEVNDETSGPTSVIKLISSGTPTVSVRAA